MVLTGIGEGKVTVTEGPKILRKFAELPSFEKKKLLVKLLDAKVDELLPEEEEEDEEMADNQQKKALNPGECSFIMVETRHGYDCKTCL